MEPFVVRVEDTEAGAAIDYAFIRSPIRIGRSLRNDICVSQGAVSAWHGLIEFDPLHARYTDLGSTNGSAVNGAPVEPRSPVSIGPRDEVTLGPVRLTFPSRAPRPAGARTAVTEVRRIDAAPETARRVEPGGITAIMQQLARSPVEDYDSAWRRVLFPGTVIGRFELVRELGRGSFGIVYEARDRQLGRLVAFKAVLPGRESQVRLRQDVLQKEAEAVAQLSHPNIVSLYDVGTCESGPYLIFELLRGETLHARLGHGPVPLPDALDIAIDVAWALAHAHAAGVVHRDLKPANIFLCTGGAVKVLDFGIAHVFGGSAAGATSGTPAYMAPEQWRHERQDARTDVFGAAAVLAELVTGRLPYRVTREWSAALEPEARPDLDAPGTPRELVALLRRALSADPARRPADGQAWLTELLAIHERRHEPERVAGARPRGPAGANAGVAPPVGPCRRDVAPLQAPPRAWRWWVPAGVAVALLGAILLYLLAR